MDLWYKQIQIRERQHYNHCSPEGGPQDAVANDEVKFLQVRCGTVLQHAVPLEAIVSICQPPGDLVTLKKTRSILSSKIILVFCAFI